MGRLWLAGLLWRDLQLDRFWAERLPTSRKRTRWDHGLQVLVAYRLIELGSEWRLHRELFSNSAMADLLGSDFGLTEAHKLYACHDLLLAHKDALFSHLTQRWRDLFNADFDVLLYDLTSTYFEVNAADLPEDSKRRHGYSRDKRPDCPQLVIALVVTPEGCMRIRLRAALGAAGLCRVGRLREALAPDGRMGGGALMIAPPNVMRWGDAAGRENRGGAAWHHGEPRRAFAGLARLLAAGGGRVLAPGIRGYGESPRAEGDFSTAALLADFAAAVPVDPDPLNGHSFGGYLA
jgi:hypothetical protein